MSNFRNECEAIILDIHKLLTDNPEWIKRYAKYAPEMLKNLETIKDIKKRFHERKPLHLYMNVCEAKGKMLFGVRYLGQDVAKIQVSAQHIKISTKGFDDSNKRDFDCEIKLDDCEWGSKKASDFRNCFSKGLKRTTNSGKNNDEHRLESLLLTEFIKKSSEDKLILNIQPVKLAGHARFQMPTPLTASNINKIHYANSNGGGIDIISRIGSGKATKLCIMEVKDENTFKEPPTKAIQQGLAYAAFIRELLRSESGEKWWKLFGFKGQLPKSIEVYVVCVMPTIPKNDTSFAGTILEKDSDSFHLHYMYFQEKDNKLEAISSSLPQCQYSNSCCQILAPRTNFYPLLGVQNVANPDFP